MFSPSSHGFIPHVSNFYSNLHEPRTGSWGHTLDLRARVAVYTNREPRTLLQHGVLGWAGWIVCCTNLLILLHTRLGSSNLDERYGATGHLSLLLSMFV